LHLYNVIELEEVETELQNFDIADVTTERLTIDYLRKLSFERTYLALLNVISKRDSKKRKKQRRLMTAAKRTKPTEGTCSVTPEQSIPTPNPNYSGSTSESTDEESTKCLLSGFLLDTMRVLGGAVRELQWPTTDCKVELTKTYQSF